MKIPAHYFKENKDLSIAARVIYMVLKDCEDELTEKGIESKQLAHLISATEEDCLKALLQLKSKDIIDVELTKNNLYQIKILKDLYKLKKKITTRKIGR